MESDVLAEVGHEGPAQLKWLDVIAHWVKQSAVPPVGPLLADVIAALSRRATVRWTERSDASRAVRRGTYKEYEDGHKSRSAEPAWSDRDWSHCTNRRPVCTLRV